MQKQQQVLQQTFKLSPQQIQVFRMLELPVLELEAKVRRALEENPTLVEGHAQSNNDTSDNNDEQHYTDDKRASD